MRPPIILLNGWPGVGKDTVAETLKLLLGDDKASLVDWSKSQAETFRPVAEDDLAGQKAQRDACFTDQVAHPALRKKIVICTHCLPDTREGRRLAQDFESVANRCNRLLIPVCVDCRLDENMRRIANAERRVSLKDKSKSSEATPERLRLFRHALWSFSGHVSTGIVGLSFCHVSARKAVVDLLT